MDLKHAGIVPIVDLARERIDVAIRYCAPERAPREAVKLFGEDITRIEVQTLGGHDIVDLSAIYTNSYVNAGPGNDLVYGGQTGRVENAFTDFREIQQDAQRRGGVARSAAVEPRAVQARMTTATSAACSFAPVPVRKTMCPSA